MVNTMDTQVRNIWLAYAEITRRTAANIERSIADARQRTGLEALIRREWAYGAYMGWRCLTCDISDHAAFMCDDQRLEALLHRPDGGAASEHGSET